MKKTTLMQWPLMLCLAAAVGVSAAPPAAVTDKKLTEKREAEDRVRFVAQDKLAARARSEKAKGNYLEAIKLLNEVVDELKLHNEYVDSWRAAERLREFSHELRTVRREYVDRKLFPEAKKAYANADYVKASALANEAKEVCDEVSAQADVLIKASQDRIRSAKHQRDINPEVGDPQLAAREAQIKTLLASARTLLDNSKYEAAQEKIEKVFTLNPFNAEAAQLAAELYKKIYITGVKRRKADRADLLAAEEWQWVEPVFPREAAQQKEVTGIVKGVDDHGTQAKLDKIVFPKVEFNRTEISAVVERLNRMNPQYDLEGGKKGIIIEYEATARPVADEKKMADEVVDPAAAPVEESTASNVRVKNSEQQEEEAAVSNDILVTLKLNNVSLREVLNYICYQTGLKYSVSDGKVSLGFITSMSSRQFYIASAVTRLINNYAGGNDQEAAAAVGDEMGGGEEEESGKKASGKAATAVDLADEQLKKFFTLFGVTFPENSSIAQEGTSIVMTNTDENLQRMADVLQELNVAKPMVQVEVKSIELTDEDLEELGFNWALNTLSRVKGKTNRGGGNQGWELGPGNNTDYTDDGEAKVMSMLNSMLSSGNTTPHLIKGLNIFPDLFGSTKPFGSDVALNLTLTINALDRSDRTEIVSAPKVLVNSGEQATVIMGRRYYYPESWDELEIEVDEGNNEGTWSITITEPVPTFGESELYGTIFTVKPTVLDDNRTIRMEINPKTVSGGQSDNETYNINLDVFKDGQLVKELSRVYKIWRPVIKTQELNVQVDVFHGETLVLGGLSDSRSSSRLDKIPILADIPFIGRLFQSHSEQSVRRNTLIFVTAKLMDNAGVPVRRLESNFGIPEIGR